MGSFVCSMAGGWFVALVRWMLGWLVDCLNRGAAGFVEN